ncbi:glycerophosphoryl diester phosphodiesterase [Nakamurella sp. UYEF19]|uniref:glycerophosphodiester phosphodiesterase n=1 Tax=Nakamurella sp. UYEF19 TaxID=1756392 RepID=UPI0033930AB9
MSIAHRGEPVAHRENTMESVAAAIDAGADMVEIDVRATGDGTLMVLHDAELTRLWKVPHLLAELDLAQVRALTSPAGERVPTLADVARLASERQCQLMVDLPDPVIGPAAFDELQRLRVLDSMLFAGNTGPLRAHAPTARIALSWENLELPSEDLLRERRPAFFNPYFRLLTAGIVDDMHAKGIQVSVWTVDHPADMAAAIAQGADAIISNEIALLETVIKGRRSS